MLALERQKRILELLSIDGAVMVSKLSAEMGVTEETVRRDLEKLEANELLRRTHGGAIPIDGGSYELSLEKRKALNVEVKQALAKKAVQSVASGDTIFLDASTTTFYMAKELKTMKNITVITNSLRVINELAGVEGIKLIAVGGIVSNNQSFVGATTENFITENYFADTMFFSRKGIRVISIIYE
ncbi:MAG: DeoR/GlpR transcriptional regulator, partial [Clostridia bacterium]|nr:DeoR/GlpR transcriptional regulator [Clostridia bacterium]